MRAPGLPRAAGVIGAPVRHSLSPHIHRIWAEREGFEAAYVPLHVEPGCEALKRAVEALAAAGFAGVNVTLPHKEDALAIAAAASPAARAAGAANMLTFSPDGPLADNSDVSGFAAALAGALRAGERPERAVILGAGGAARAVILALQAAGVGDILVLNRTAERAAALAGAFGVRAGAWDARNAALAGAGIVVNATSLGMVGEPALEIDLAALGPEALVADIVYRPLKTPLLAAAATRGLRTLDGLEMLMHQARPGYLAWLGARAEVDADLRAKLVALLGEGEPKERPMIVVGLTGSIGMGKSTVAAMFAAEGARVWSADEAVHRLYARGGPAVAPLQALFPDAIRDGAVDRARLAEIVLARPDALARIEAVVHPLVAADRQAFLAEARGARARLAVLEIPLLFETGAQGSVDAIVVVSAPEAIQRARTLARPGMSEPKLAAILARQTPDAEKRQRADYVVPTGGTLGETRAAVAEVVGRLLRASARDQIG